MSVKKNMHVGLRAYRLLSDRQSSGRERAFAEIWKKEQNESRLLEHLLREGNNPGNVSERDAQIAATIIQWLGTNVGQDFLEKVNAEVQRQIALENDGLEP